MAPQRIARLLALATVLLAPAARGQLDADFTAGVTTGEVPLEVAFHDATTGGTPLVFKWTFGDGTTSQLNNPTHVYTAPGTYDVSLKVTSAVFQSDTELKPAFVVVQAAPLTPSFTVAPSSGVNPLVVSFTDTTSGSAPDAWHWQFGDGGTSDAQHPQHTYTAPGRYPVTLTTHYFGQSESVTVPDAVVVQPAPLTLAVSAEPGAGALPLPVSFTDESRGAEIDAWLWDFGDGGTSDEQHPQHVYLAPGSYTVRLDAWVGQQQETLVLPDLITVDPVPLDAAFVLDAPTGQNPHVVTFTDVSTGTLPDAWQWEFGDGATSTLQDPTYRYRSPGVFDVTLTVWVAQQSSTVTQRGAVTVAPAPIVPALGADPMAGPAQLEVTFRDRSTGATPDAWLWDFGDGYTSTEQHPVHEFQAPGTYPVSLTTWVGAQADTVAQPVEVRVGPFGGLFLQVDDVAFPASGFDNDWIHQISVSGSVVIEGDSRGDELGTDSGRAHVMERQPDGNWALVAELLASDGASGDLFGYAVSAGCEVAVVGALGDDDAGSLSGSVYVFERQPDGAWPQAAKLTASDAAAGDRFGTSVSVSGNLAVVGAFEGDQQGVTTGAVYVFERAPSGEWIEVQKLTPEDGTSQMRFGEAVDLDGRRLVVGAPGMLHDGGFAGGATVWERGAGGLFSQVATLVSGDIEQHDWLGGAVALSGGRALLGARHHDDLGPSSGAAYVFERQPDGSWPQVAELLAADGLGLDYFGNAVALDGEWAVAGAFGADSSGGAYVFHRQPDGSWPQVAKLVPATPPHPSAVGRGVAVWGGMVASHAVSYDVSVPGLFDRLGFFELVEEIGDVTGGSVWLRQGPLVLRHHDVLGSSAAEPLSVRVLGAVPGDLVALSVAPSGPTPRGAAPTWLPPGLTGSAQIAGASGALAFELPALPASGEVHVQAWVARPHHVEVSNVLELVTP